jgi:hypothetical protein
MFMGVAVSVAAFGGGVASADPLNGKTYSDAVSTIAGWSEKATAVIATVSGSQVDTADCIVTSWHKSSFRDTSGVARSGEYLLNLDCNKRLASPGHPGNSSVSIQGRQEKKDEANAKYIATNPSICDKDENTVKWCTDLCTKTGLCEYGS